MCSWSARAPYPHILIPFVRYRPETKQEKKARLTAAAQEAADGKTQVRASLKGHLINLQLATAGNEETDIRQVRPQPYHRPHRG